MFDASEASSEPFSKLSFRMVLLMSGKAMSIIKSILVLMSVVEATESTMCLLMFSMPPLSFWVSSVKFAKAVCKVLSFSYNLLAMDESLCREMAWVVSLLLVMSVVETTESTCAC